MAVREKRVCGRRELGTLPVLYNPRHVKDGPLSLADVYNWPAAQKIVTYFDPDSPTFYFLALTVSKWLFLSILHL